ncbi:MAG: homoserine kinase [Bacillota bacterium]
MESQENSRSVVVKVPATSANLGPGFDCLGLAVQVYYRFSILKLSNLAAKRLETKLKVELNLGADRTPLSIDTEGCLITKAVGAFSKKTGIDVDGIKIIENLPFPPGKGLGSSAAAIVGTLVGLASLYDKKLTDQEILELAIALEGHPDNITAALNGGLNITCTTAAKGSEDSDSVFFERLHPHPDLGLVLAVPDLTALTGEQRAVLPEKLPLKDMTFNQSRTALLPFALSSGRWERLEELLQDRIHQPYRTDGLKAWSELKTAAKDAGALGLVLSGAGPTVLAFTRGEEEEIARAIQETWAEAGVTAEAVITGPDVIGARISL